MTDNTQSAGSAFRVRPYLVTGGRTRSVVDLPIEALVRSTPLGHRAVEKLSHELRDIVSLCVNPQSLAEISARLKIHLQVARVLVGDLVQAEQVAIHTASKDNDRRPDLQLLEKVLDGLQSL